MMIKVNGKLGPRSPHVVFLEFLHCGASLCGTQQENIQMEKVLSDAWPRSPYAAMWDPYEHSVAESTANKNF